jgi:hypothetical protein
MRLLKGLFLCIGLLATCGLHAQYVNAYGQVASITGGGTVVTLTTKNESYDSFEDGEFVIIMEMQGASVSTTLNSSFGSITSIGSTGLYEMATILSHTPTTFTLTAPLSNTYNTSTGTVQMISYPEFGGGGDYTTTGNMQALEWDGIFGGVLAFNVSGNLYLAHEVSADSMGFDWGDKAGNDASDCFYFTLPASYWADAIGSPEKGGKGESIYNATASQEAGKAKSANGGGGGIVHNGGGGGGGNFTNGGDGHTGTPGACGIASVSAGGQGGEGLSGDIAISRIFMGGGGGGGQENNSKGTHGGFGGGIVIIEADSIFTSCAGTVKISANGSDAPSKKNDGQGGGGAGGSIILFTEYIGANATCPLTISANGGDGGTVNHIDPHGSGGGGGQGVIFIDADAADLMPMDYLNINTLNGHGGATDTSASPSYAEDGGGVDDSGIFFGEAPLLPVDFISFDAASTGLNQVDVQWVTGSETNCDHYELYRSNDGIRWEIIAVLPGNGTTNIVSTYQFNDTHPHEWYNYYIVKQVDESNRGRNSNMVSVFFEKVSNSILTVTPNPVQNETFTLMSEEDLIGARIQIHNLLGQEVPYEVLTADTHQISIRLSQAVTGYHLLTIKTAQGTWLHRKLLVE